MPVQLETSPSHQPRQLPLLGDKLTSLHLFFFFKKYLFLLLILLFRRTIYSTFVNFLGSSSQFNADTIHILFLYSDDNKGPLVHIYCPALQLVTHLPPFPFRLPLFTLVKSYILKYNITLFPCSTSFQLWSHSIYMIHLSLYSVFPPSTYSSDIVVWPIKAHFLLFLSPPPLLFHREIIITQWLHITNSLLFPLWLLLLLVCRTNKT